MRKNKKEKDKKGNIYCIINFFKGKYSDIVQDINAGIVSFKYKCFLVREIHNLR